MSNVYICYDKVQRNYFYSKGLSDVVYGLHPKTMKPFWVFERNEEFNIAISEWISK